MLVETVPNVSLGPQDPALEDVLADIRAAQTPAAQLLDVHTDRDHRRTVLTIAGAPAPVLRLTTRLADALLDHASLAGHEGVHPRVGLLDVVPFVALDAPDGAVERVAEATVGRLAQRAIPVYRYARLARRAETRELASVRSSLHEVGLGENPSLTPDAGPSQLHEHAGASCVGVRAPLIAYNVVLDSGDLDVGRRIAAGIRESGGGLPGVQALAFALGSQGDRVQVSTNLTEPSETGTAEVFEHVRSEAREAGVEVVGGELVGLAPREAMPQNPSRMGLESTPASLEDRLAAAGFELSAPI